jgi:hypothetical protein
MITRSSKKRKKDEKSMDCSELSISLIARVRSRVRRKTRGLAGRLILRVMLCHSRLILVACDVERRTACLIYKHKKQ